MGAAFGHGRRHPHGISASHELTCDPHELFCLVCYCNYRLRSLRRATWAILNRCSCPIYYVLGTFIVGWFAASGTGSVTGRKARLLTAAYPTVEHFLWLLIPFIIAVGIALFRWWVYREELARRAAREAFARRRRVNSERNNRESYTRARTRSIEELREASERRRRDPTRSRERRISMNGAEGSEQASGAHRVERRDCPTRRAF